MISHLLRDARIYEENAEKEISPDERPAFHLTPRVGWLNDPNGFSFYGGQYHLYYQYYPYASHWDDMHWGHAVSKDLLHWEYLPAVMAPDTWYDEKGCFSGSAITLHDGRQLLMYTGVRGGLTTDFNTQDIQVQCVAVGDGMNFEKYEGNPVIDSKDIPDGGSVADFRDPKILPHGDGYIALVSNRPADGSGRILLYKSPDGFHWSYWKVLDENKNRLGLMWECPDFFPLDGKQLLMVSPQDMLPEGYRYHNGDGTVLLYGSYDEETGEFVEEGDQPIDGGIDFYAPQTILTEDGRRVMIGWLQNWDACAIREKNAPWAGQMSVPRELRFLNGKLYQRPIRELELYRTNEVSYENILVEGGRIEKEKTTHLAGVEGRVIDMEVELFRAPGEDLYYKFTIRVGENEHFNTSISFRSRENTLTINRRFSGTRRAILNQRRAQVEDKDGRLSLRIILDRFSLEVFAEDGALVMSSCLYTPLDAKDISFLCDGKAVINVKKWDLVL